MARQRRKKYKDVSMQEKLQLKDMYYNHADWQEMVNTTNISQRTISKILRQDLNINTYRKRRCHYLSRKKT